MMWQPSLWWTTLVLLLPFSLCSSLPPNGGHLFSVQIPQVRYVWPDSSLSDWSSDTRSLTEEQIEESGRLGAEIERSRLFSVIEPIGRSQDILQTTLDNEEHSNHHSSGNPALEENLWVTDGDDRLIDQPLIEPSDDDAHDDSSHERRNTFGHDDNFGPNYSSYSSYDRSDLLEDELQTAESNIAFNTMPRIALPPDRHNRIPPEGKTKDYFDRIVGLAGGKKKLVVKEVQQAQSLSHGVFHNPTSNSGKNLSKDIEGNNVYFVNYKDFPSLFSNIRNIPKSAKSKPFRKVQQDDHFKEILQLIPKLVKSYTEPSSLSEKKYTKRASFRKPLEYLRSNPTNRPVVNEAEVNDDDRSAEALFLQDKSLVNLSSGENGRVKIPKIISLRDGANRYRYTYVRTSLNDDYENTDHEPIEEETSFRGPHSIPTREDAILRLNHARALRREKLNKIKEETEVRSSNRPPMISASLLEKAILVSKRNRPKSYTGNDGHDTAITVDDNTTSIELLDEESFKHSSIEDQIMSADNSPKATDKNTSREIDSEGNVKSIENLKPVTFYHQFSNNSPPQLIPVPVENKAKSISDKEYPKSMSVFTQVQNDHNQNIATISLPFSGHLKPFIKSPPKQISSSFRRLPGPDGRVSFSIGSKPSVVDAPHWHDSSLVPLQHSTTHRPPVFTQSQTVTNVFQNEYPTVPIPIQRLLKAVSNPFLFPRIEPQVKQFNISENMIAKKNLKVDSRDFQNRGGNRGKQTTIVQSSSERTFEIHDDRFRPPRFPTKEMIHDPQMLADRHRFRDNVNDMRQEQKVKIIADLEKEQRENPLHLYSIADQINLYENTKEDESKETSSSERTDVKNIAPKGNGKNTDFNNKIHPPPKKLTNVPLTSSFTGFINANNNNNNNHHNRGKSLNSAARKPSSSLISTEQIQNQRPAMMPAGHKTSGSIFQTNNNRHYHSELEQPYVQTPRTAISSQQPSNFQFGQSMQAPPGGRNVGEIFRAVVQEATARVYAAARASSA